MDLPGTSSDGRLWKFLASIIPVALNLLVFLPVYSGTAIFFERDAFANYPAVRFAMAMRFWSGELPLWTDQILGGLPLWADPGASVLFPGQFVFYLLAPWVSAFHLYGIVVGLHFLLAQSGFARLLRELGTGSVLAAAGSVLIAYSPAALSLHWGLQFLYGFSVMGFALTALIRLIRSPGLRRMLELAFLVALLVFSGDLQAAYLFGLLALAVTLLMAKDRRRSLVSIGAALAAGGIFSAAVILPGFEYSRETAREQQNLAGISLRWSWHPARLLEFISPGMFDPPREADVDLSPVGIGPTGEGSVYFNRGQPFLLAGILFPLGFVFVRRDRRMMLLGCLIVISGWLALGRHGGLYEWLGWVLPGWKQFRFPERILFYGILAANLWAVLAVSLWTKPGAEPDQAGKAAKAVRWTGLCWLLITGIVAVLDPVASFVAGLTGIQAGPAWIAFLQSQSGLALLPLGLCVTALWLPEPHLRLRPLLFAGALVVELSVFALPALRLVPSSAVAGVPVSVRMLRQELSPPVAPQISVMLQTALPGLRPFEEESARSFWDRIGGNFVLFTPYVREDGVASAWIAGHLAANRVIPAGVRHRLQGLEAVLVPAGASVAPQPGEAWECGALPEFPGAGICRMKDPLRRVRAPERWSYFRDPAALEAAAKELSTWENGRELIGRFLKPVDFIPEIPEGEGGAVTLTVQHWSDQEKRLSVTRDRPGPVVIGTNFFPGWEARVNGQPAPVFAMNGFQLATWTPAGSSSVEFAFRPKPVFTGIWISLLSLAMAGIWWFRGDRRPAR